MHSSTSGGASKFPFPIMFLSNNSARVSPRARPKLKSGFIENKIIPGWDAGQCTPAQGAAEGAMPSQRIIQNETEALTVMLLNHYLIGKGLGEKGKFLSCSAVP